MGFGRVWALSAAVFFALSLCWIIGNPIGAGPDEPAHVIKAAATVRGGLVGSSVPHRSTAMREMTVPDAYAQTITMPDCYQYVGKRTARCAPGWNGSSSPDKVQTYVGRYPPWYYFVVGLPTLVTSSVWGFYAMRMLSALMCAALVGLAIAISATLARSRLMLLGVVVCITPMLVFMSAIVNPSSVEMSAGLCAWVAGIVLVLDHAEHPPRALVAAFVGSGIVLALMRSISPLWLVIVVATMFLLEPNKFLGWLRRPGPMRKVLVSLGVVSVVAGLVTIAMRAYAIYPEGRPVPKGASSLRILRLTLNRTDIYYHQFIGNFGWLDTPVPPPTTIIWTVLLVGVVVVGLVSGSRRQRTCMILIGIAVIAIPTFITASHARVDGLVWQARYSYPLDVGVLVLACAATPAGSLARRAASMSVTGVGVVAASFGQLAAYYQNIRRYVVGINGPVQFLFGHSREWAPPLEPTILVAAMALALVFYASWLLTLARSEPPPEIERARPRELLEVAPAD
jgi:hypothetical protein